MSPFRSFANAQSEAIAITNGPRPGLPLRLPIPYQGNHSRVSIPEVYLGTVPNGTYLEWKSLFCLVL